jgi:hypothetical protein
MPVRFSWERRKEAINSKKHDGVTFVEAASVFRDGLAYIFDGANHSDDEHRELIIGHSERGRLLIVAFSEQEETIRIISARKADASERTDYEKARR